MKTTQLEIIENHLKKYGSITTYHAFTEYGITRLSHYIYVLRNKGYNIENSYKTKKNRYGNNVSFAKYILTKEGE